TGNGVLEGPGEAQQRTRRVRAQDLAERAQVADGAVVDDHALVVVEEAAPQRRKVDGDGDGGGEERGVAGPGGVRRRGRGCRDRRAAVGDAALLLFSPAHPAARVGPPAATAGGGAAGGGAAGCDQALSTPP